MKNATIYILLIICGCLGIYVWANEGREALSSPVQAITTSERRIMSIRQLQTLLNEKGHIRYTCEVDGKMGKETIRAWSNYICDRNYKESTYVR